MRMHGSRVIPDQPYVALQPYPPIYNGQLLQARTRKWLTEFDKQTADYPTELLTYRVPKLVARKDNRPPESPSPSIFSITER